MGRLSASSNMEDIKAKVIYNEGMTYAHGIYSSVYEMLSMHQILKA